MKIKFQQLLDSNEECFCTNTSKLSKPPSPCNPLKNQSGNDLSYHPTGWHQNKRSQHRTNTATHHQVSEVPPEMHHHHPNEWRSTWPPWNSTIIHWLQKHQQQPDMGCSYQLYHRTSSTNGLRRGCTSSIRMGEIYQTHWLPTPIPTQCTTTWEG